MNELCCVPYLTIEDALYGIKSFQVVEDRLQNLTCNYRVSEFENFYLLSPDSDDRLLGILPLFDPEDPRELFCNSHVEPVAGGVSVTTIVAVDFTTAIFLDDSSVAAKHLLIPRERMIDKIYLYLRGTNHKQAEEYRKTMLFVLSIVRKMGGGYVSRD